MIENTNALCCKHCDKFQNQTIRNSPKTQVAKHKKQKNSDKVKENLKITFVMIYRIKQIKKRNSGSVVNQKVQNQKNDVETFSKKATRKETKTKHN